MTKSEKKKEAGLVFFFFSFPFYFFTSLFIYYLFIARKTYCNFSIPTIVSADFNNMKTT